MKRKDIKDILYKVNSGTASPEEEEIAMYWLHYFRNKDAGELSETELTEESEAIFSSLMAQHDVKPAKIRRLWYPAAAAVLFLISAGIYYLVQKTGTDRDHALKVVKLSKNEIKDIAPGKTTATLVLADGKRIFLSNTASGLIAKQNGVSIFKTADGKLIYKDNKEGLTAAASNTIITANGQQYQLILQDGTRIWINAGSSLTYPATFAALKNRKVKLSGEAYFEVAKDKKHPFIVQTSKQKVEVLGTHFNVSSYKDEDITKTTLLEGSVRVSDNKERKVLVPGQQSLLAQNKLKVKKIDVAQAVAWKNGDFIFNDEEFSSILRQISRWYNVEIISNGDYKDLHLSGTVSRSKNISTVLKALEITGKVKFKIEGKRILVVE